MSDLLKNTRVYVLLVEEHRSVSLTCRRTQEGMSNLQKNTGVYVWLSEEQKSVWLAEEHRSICLTCRSFYFYFYFCRRTQECTTCWMKKVPSPRLPMKPWPPSCTNTWVSIILWCIISLYLGQYCSVVYHITVPGSVLFCSVSYHCAWVSIKTTFLWCYHFTWLTIKTTCVYHCTWVSIKTTFVWCSPPPGSVLRSYLFLWCSSLNLRHYQDHKIFLWCSSVRSVARPYFFGVYVLGQYQDHIHWCSSVYLGQYQDHISLAFITILRSVSRPYFSGVYIYTWVSIKTIFLWCSSLPRSVLRPHFSGVHQCTWVNISTTFLWCSIITTWVSIKTTFHHHMFIFCIYFHMFITIQARGTRQCPRPLTTEASVSQCSVVCMY